MKPGINLVGPHDLKNKILTSEQIRCLIFHLLKNFLLCYGVLFLFVFSSMLCECE